jgi:hypothetical protein
MSGRRARGNAEEQDPAAPAALAGMEALAQAMTQAMQGLTQAVTQLVAANQAANQPAVNPNPNPQFLLSPLETSAAGIIDYATKDGKKLHKRATKPLFGKDDLFDVEPSCFDAFMHKLAT